MDSRIKLSAVVATALVLAACANNAEATEPAAAPPAFSSGDAGGDKVAPAGSDAGGDKVAPASSDAGGDKVAPAGSDAGGDKVAPEGATTPGE